MKDKYLTPFIAFMLGMAIASLATYGLMKTTIETSYQAGYTVGSISQAQAISYHEQEIYAQGYLTGYEDGISGFDANIPVYNTVEVHDSN